MMTHNSNRASGVKNNRIIGNFKSGVYEGLLYLNKKKVYITKVRVTDQVIIDHGGWVYLNG
jgi:hypothetical protein